MLRLKLHWWILIGIVVGAAVGTVFNLRYYPEIQQQARAEVFQGASYDAAQEMERTKEIQ